jgi:hypothetical protein
MEKTPSLKASRRPELIASGRAALGEDVIPSFPPEAEAAGEGIVSIQRSQTRAAHRQTV